MGVLSPGTSWGVAAPMRRWAERGQGTVEWVGLLAVVALLLVGLVAARGRVPGTELARAVASRMLCAVAMADRCGDEPALIAAYGTEVGRLVRRHMPTILFERGSRALPVDFRRCRSSDCGDGSARGLVHESDAGLPVTAFVHVIDCRGATDAASTATGRAATASRLLRPSRRQPLPPVLDLLRRLGDPARRPDRRRRLSPKTTGRASRSASARTAASTSAPPPTTATTTSQSVANAGIGRRPRSLCATSPKAIGARPRNGWGPETRLLVVSGGSHAGNANGSVRIDRIAPGRRIHLVPLEPIAEEQGGAYRFAVSPPWRKRVWRDPEAEGTS